MFDQLLYGVDGEIRVLAATPGLLGRGHPAATLVIEACGGAIPDKVYDTDGSQVAFGWSTVGDLRVVYQRAFDRAEGSRRYASVHVIVGPVWQLPVTKLVARYCSPGWWRRGSFDRLLAADVIPDPLSPRLLRPATLEDLPPAPQRKVSAGDRLAVTRAALTALTGKSSTLDMEPAAVAGLLAELARDAPALLELIDASTCDPPPIDPRDRRRRPHLAGHGAARPTGSIAPAGNRADIDRVARLIASDQRDDHLLIASASSLALVSVGATPAVNPAATAPSGQSAAAPSTAPTVEHFIALSCLSDDLRRTGQITASDVVPFLGDGHTASEILKMTDGDGTRVVSRLIARALLARDPGVSSAVMAVGPTLDPAVAERLGRDLGECALGAPAPRSLADALGHVLAVPTVRQGVLLAALDAPEPAWGHLDLLDGAVRAECCRLSRARRPAEDGLAGPLHRLLTAAKDIRYLAGRVDLPPQWRATALVEMVRDRRGTDVEWVAGQLQMNTSLVDPFAQQIAPSPDSVVELLRHMPPEAVLSLVPWLSRYCEPAQRARVLWTASQLVPRASLKTFVITYADPTSFNRWHETVENLTELVARNAAREMVSGAGWRPTAEDAQLVRLLDGPAARLWVPVFDFYAGAGDASRLGDSIIHSVTTDAQFFSSEARPALWTLAFSGIVSSGSDWNYRHDTVDRLSALQPSVLAREVMTAALLAKRWPEQDIPRKDFALGFALMVVARRVANGSLEVTATGQLTDPSLHDLAKRVRAESRKDQPNHNRLKREVARCGDSAQRWWRDLNPEPVHKRVRTAVVKLVNRRKPTDASTE
jgi:hypothetical protein